jgi:hypothetical protein
VCENRHAEGKDDGGAHLARARESVDFLETGTGNAALEDAVVLLGVDVEWFFVEGRRWRLPLIISELGDWGGYLRPGLVLLQWDEAGRARRRSAVGCGRLSMRRLGVVGWVEVVFCC